MTTLLFECGYAFGYGLLAFFSPCILPLLPGYFSFIVGASIEDLVSAESEVRRRRVFFSTLAFVLGVCFVFIALFFAVSVVGNVMQDYQSYIRVAGGIVVIIFGLHFLGLFRLKFLDVEKRIHLKTRPAHVAGAFLIGMAFAAGWSPCIGVYMAAAMTLAAPKETITGGILIGCAFSIGLSLPFLVLSLSISSLLRFLKKANKVLPYVNRVAGCAMILMGFLLVFDKFNMINMILFKLNIISS